MEVVVKKSPCKKFTLYSKIKNEIRSALRRENVWVHNVPMGLLKRFNKDVQNHVVPVRGTNYKDVEYNLIDVISLFNHLEIEVKEPFIGKKLRNCPMFSSGANINLEKELETDAFHHFVKKSNFNDMLEMYEVKRSRFDARQNYKINGNFKYDKWSTYMLCLDLSLEFLLCNSPRKLASYLCNELKGLRYSRIDVDGVYYFALHLAVRGICRPTAMQELYNWRDAWKLRNIAERDALLAHFYSGIAFPDVIGLQECYLSEQTERTSLLRKEGNLIRINYLPDRSIFNPELVFYTTWYEGIYSRMSDVERHRSSTGLLLAANRFDLPSHSCYQKNGRFSKFLSIERVSNCDACSSIEAEPTVFTGLAANAITNGINDALPQMKSAVQETIEATLSNPENSEKIKNLTQQATTPVIDHLTSRLDELKTKTVDELKATVQPVLNESLSTFASFNGIFSFVRNAMDQIIKMVPIDMLSRVGIKIDMETLFEVFKYYILYINVDNSFLRGAFVILILRELGLFGILSKYGALLVSWMRNFNGGKLFAPIEGSIESEPTSAFEWSNTIMSMLSGSLPGVTVCTFITLALSLMFRIAINPTNTRFNKSDHSSIYSSILSGMKDLHFIGAGMYGMERIAKYVTLIGNTISEWVSQYVFGNSVDARKNEKAVSLWYGKLQYLKTEPGRSAIRVSEKVLKMAEQIQPDGLAFLHAYAQDPKYISRESASMIQRSQKDAADIASFCFRIRAMSQFKPAMFHIQFVGKPGIGKSQLTEALISRLSAKLFPPDEKITHYSYNPNVEYFDGYQSQKFMIIDDLFRFNEPKHMSLLIGLITNTPVLLPMAHLDEKGMQLESDILISSTNTPYPEAKDVYCMDAVHRRRHILIEVIPDMDVMDKANSKFSMHLFQKKYPGQNSNEFPHLSFNLLKPVVEAHGDKIKQTTFDEQHELLTKLRKIQQINQTLHYTDEEYFGPDQVPEGIQYPCRDWTFNKLVEQIAGRYAAQRASERKLTVKGRYTQVMDCFSEIDAIQKQITEVPSKFELDDKLELISRFYLDATYAYGIDDPLGEKIYLKDENSAINIKDMPEVDKLENLESELIRMMESEEAQPTGISEPESYKTSLTSTTKLDNLEIISNYLSKHKPQGLEKERVQALYRIFQTSDLCDLSEEEDKTWNMILDSAVEDEVDDQTMIVNYVEETLAQKYKAVESELLERRRVRELKYQQQQELIDFAGDFYHTKIGKRFAMNIKSDYQNELVAESNIDTKVASKIGDVVFEPMLSPFAFVKSLEQRKLVDDLYAAGVINAIRHKKIKDFLNDCNGDLNKVIIPRSPKFKSVKHGRITTIPKAWMKRMILIKNEWKLDLTDLYFESSEIPQTTKASKHPIANILLSQPDFTMAMQEFAMMSHEQQTHLVESVYWMNQYIPSIANGSWRNSLSRIASTIKEKLMSYVFSPLKYFWDVVSSVGDSKIFQNATKLLSHLAYFAIGVLALRKLGSLLTGVQEPTSKVLHRSALRSVPFKGRNVQPTGIFSNSRNTDCQLADAYLDRNIRYIYIRHHDGMFQKCHAIHTEQFLIINAHMAQDIIAEVEIEFCPTPRHDDKWSFKITPENIYICPKTDVAIIFSRKLPMAKSINKHFITQKDYENFDRSMEMWSLSRFEDEAATEIRTGGTPHIDVSLHNTEQGVYGFINQALYVPGETVVGKSGAMLMIPNKSSGNRNIVGVQAWRIRDSLKPLIIYQVITQEMLTHMIEKVTTISPYPYIQQEGPIIADPTGSPKAKLLVDSHIDVVGSLPIEAITGKVGKTAFRKTPIANLMDRDGYTSKRVPAALNPYDPRLNIPVHPMQNSLNKCGRGIVGPFDPELLDKASTDIAYWIKDRLDQIQFDTNLSLAETITGVRKPGSNPIDCRASAGLPYILDKYPGKPAGKKSLIEIDEFGNAVINDPYYPEKFEEFYNKLRHGIIPPHSSYDFPKDELRPITKALGDAQTQSPPKTRSVTCMSLDIILSWRRVTCDLFASLHRAARGNFPFAPGMNPEGPDWTRLYHYLNVNKNIVDFDVSNWDGHMTSDLMYAAGDCILRILDKAPHTPEAKVIYSILTEVIFGHVQFEDMVYKKFRGLISGFPGTAEMNTLAHYILFYYFYLCICKNHEFYHLMNIATFSVNCHSIFYGDDVQASISDEFIEWFNGVTIAYQYELHGYPVTDASKSRDIAPFKDIQESQFLKSGFNVISPARVDRTLDISVVYDLFYWVRAKDHPEDQFYSNLHDAFRVLHGHGSAVYEGIRIKLNGWLRELGKEPFSVYWRDFELAHVKNYYE